MLRASFSTMVLSRRWVLAAAALVAVGCLSPTLPLPPPSKPTVEGPDPETGEVTLSGREQEGADVFAANMRTGEVRGQLDLNRDGFYEFTLPAQVGDQISFWYTLGTEESPSILFTIREPNP